METLILIIVSITLIIQFVIVLFIIYPFLKRKLKYISDKKNVSHPKQQMFVLSQISEAVVAIKKINKGALIIIEKNDKTESTIFDGELIDARVSRDLLVNIFEGSKTPLHDGAVVIRGDRIIYAGGFISALTTKKFSRSYGTRHRSAIGLTQKNDAIALIVSEETKKISIVSEGIISEISESVVFEELSNILIGENYYKK